MSVLPKAEREKEEDSWALEPLRGHYNLLVFPGILDNTN